jgi:hypothetical protein
VALLEAVADARVLRLVETILEDRPCCRSLQYMMSPARSSTDGNSSHGRCGDYVPISTESAQRHNRS